MKFTPLTEAQLEASRLLQDGEYPFEVIAASEETSKRGNPMIKLKLNVFGPDGRTQHVYDYLSDSFMEHKLRHFCYGTGLSQAYEAGHIEARSCENRQGRVRITIEEGRDGYKAKNVVDDYLVPTSLQPADKPINANKEDDIPF